MRYLVFDISNLLYRTFFVQRQEESDETLAGLATHTALVTLNKYYKLFKPDRVVMAFDRTSWRKEYTASEKCVSKKPYKGNRRKDMSPAKQAKYLRFLNHLNEFEGMMRNHTTIITLQEEKMEADDMIAGFVQIYNSDEDEIIIISSDSDMLQLKRYKGVKVVSPATDKEVTLDEYDNDPELFIFNKCMRGDDSDHVQSALPRVSSKRILKAYTDPFERVQLMKETWSDHRGDFVVEKLYKENQLLMDLEKQPPEIRAKLLTAVEEAMNKEREFSLFFIMKFIGKYKLNKIKENIDHYLPLLSKR
jgi:5'-3' exonuclease